VSDSGSEHGKAPTGWQHAGALDLLHPGGTAELLDERPSVPTPSRSWRVSVVEEAVDDREGRCPTTEARSRRRLAQPKGDPVGKTVRVTKVTVEYAFEGKAFRVDFPDPEKIATIVFSRTDLQRLQKEQVEQTGEPIDTHFLKPGEPFPDLSGSVQVPAESTPVGSTSAPNGTFDRALWWHSSSCTWFHPEETDE